mgnify:FL=1
MSEQKRPTPQRSSASTTRRRERTQRSSSPKRGGGHGISEWLRALLAHAALFFATLGQRIRRIGPRARTVMRESKARNFPESNRFLVQVFLVIGGMFPMWHSLLHEKLQVRRRQRNHAAGTHADRWRRRARRVNPFYFIGGAAVVAAVAIFFSFYTLGTTVEYNGNVVDTVASASQARKAAAKLESVTTETLGKSYEIAKDAIHYSTAFVRRSDVTDTTTFEQDLAEELGQVTYGYSLYIDDELVGSTQYAGALDELLEQIKQMYVSADTLTVDFVENVRIAEGYVPTESVMNLGTIAELLNSTKAGEVTYTVVKGDTWGQIANNNGMTAAELEALNPGYDINRIHIGDALTLSNAVPYLTVKVTERQNYIEDINYDVNYVNDSSMYQGDERVISRGTYGSADIVADVTYVNGEEQERTVISSVTLTDPVAETRARGTKVRPTWYPTGSFRWPCSGRITSYFGYRNTGIRGATSNHKGIDIACARGTPIYAADGGRVIFSGYKGAMGYVVIIDHNNGYVTYYEHNGSLLVSAGQTVYKGQQIAKAGRSGVASGVHCHFGIQRNGTYVNPLNYLS